MVLVKACCSTLTAFSHGEVPLGEGRSGEKKCETEGDER